VSTNIIEGTVYKCRGFSVITVYNRNNLLTCC